jgi:hypothetical protein
MNPLPAAKGSRRPACAPGFLSATREWTLRFNEDYDSIPETFRDPFPGIERYIQPWP